jgi:hypothetical protein
METQIKRKIKKADFLREHTVKEYIEEFPRSYDYNNIVYDETIKDINNCTKKINELMYFKCNCDICDIEIIKTWGKYGYNKFLANKFNIEHYRLIEEDYQMSELELYLESLISKKLFAEDRDALIKKIGLKDGRGRLQKAISQLNAYLESNKMPYTIISKRIKIDNRLNTIWTIDKLIIE